MAEHRFCKPRVVGSSPTAGSMQKGESEDRDRFNQRGLTYVELIIVLALFSLILGLMATIFKLKSQFILARDFQRLKDANFLNSALNFYFRNAYQADGDGPYLENMAIDEATPTIFVSIPSSDPFNFSSFVYNSKTYYFYRTDKLSYRKINGTGWLPINFEDMKSYLIDTLPVDPLNMVWSDTGSYYGYNYAFKKEPLGYEISIFLESSRFNKGGSNDKVSTDGGNDEKALELGWDLTIIPPLPP
jgi:type II secretory pathway pseudopilin PulG